MTKGKEKQPEFAPKCAEIWPKKKEEKVILSMCTHKKATIKIWCISQVISLPKSVKRAMQYFQKEVKRII